MIKFACDLCSKQFRQKESLDSHIKHYHKSTHKSIQVTCIQKKSKDKSDVIKGEYFEPEDEMVKMEVKTESSEV